MAHVRIESSVGARRSLQSFDDHALIDLVRAGDERGLGELYRRHAPTAVRAARSLTRAEHEADDVVADVFDGIWQAIRNGKGPRIRFEPYLVAAIRNRSRAITHPDAPAPIDDDRFVLATLDHEPESWDSVTTRAFGHLRSRDQQVLWLTAVEGRSASDVANALSLTRRAASTLKFRAKRSFAEAYLSEYGAAAAARPACRELCPKLARYVRGKCSPIATRTVECHLAGCPDCRRLVHDLKNVNMTLRSIGPFAAVAIRARGLTGGGPGAGIDRMGHAALRVATSKPVLLTAAVGVVALLPAATLLLGGDHPHPGRGSSTRRFRP